MRKKEFLKQGLTKHKLSARILGTDDFARDESFSCIFSQSWHEASGMAAGMECA